MITNDSKRRRATPALFALLAVSALVGSLFFSVAVVSADGNGTSAACQTDVNVDSGDPGQSQDEVTYTAPDGWIVTGVCIKTGVSEGHMDLMTADVEGDCYTVEGIGTATVTVTRTGDASPDCQGISHVDVATGEGQESESASASASASQSEEESASASASQSEEESASASASQSEEQSVSASASQSAEQSVEGGTGTPEQSVQGGTGSPEASMGSGATSAAGSTSAIPAIAFGILAILSLGGLAAVNLATARRRR